MKITPQFFNQIQNCLITDPELYTVKKNSLLQFNNNSNKKKKKIQLQKRKTL